HARFDRQRVAFPAWRGLPGALQCLLYRPQLRGCVGWPDRGVPLADRPLFSRGYLADLFEHDRFDCGVVARSYLLKRALGVPICLFLLRFHRRVLSADQCLPTDAWVPLVSDRIWAAPAGVALGVVQAGAAAGLCGDDRLASTHAS